ncbi:L,D-transpeptidase family protein [Desulfovibrio sp. Fe33]|uniref:L,D-transpeptidase family protein n=1 Tax=Desulfovibrio sp. Fe33 TaxID=3020842 RepID=UPI00234C26C0|nr:L,D-transpeptidase family protein [Desulfovibrio sp. Fe33]
MRVALIVLTLIMSATTALAGGWTPLLSSHSYGPERIIAVDKRAQELIVLERKSPLHEVRRFPCTTGQSLGDKAVEGDMRTPEGVYFVGRRINRELDWDLYGNIAYSLNYPNPIDRIKGKTGSGIWLHGRGKTFLPRDTLGCVALKVPDMKNVALDAAYGTPVVIADDVDWTPEPGESEITAMNLVKTLEAWARDWGAKDEAFFSYYDEPLLKMSEGLDFDGFEAHKRNIFSAQPWIHVMVDNVRAIPGPGYWVTWFDQYYRTRGMASTTGKRFYWVQDEQGRWRIAGREYVPVTEELDGKYLAAKTVEARELVEKWREAWLAADVAAYGSFYERDADQGGRRGAADIADYKKTLWAKKPPVRLEIDDLKVALHPMGLKVAFDQVFADAGGYEDRGRKTLILVPEGDSWKIDSEQWRRMR